jgi:hypothetical protein
MRRFLIRLYYSADRRGVVTPEFAAEQARVAEDRDAVITNNKTYGTVKTVQPVVRKLIVVFMRII